MKVAVIGTGRVGLPLALSLLEAGVETVAVDRDPAIRRAINEERRMPFWEPGYDELAASGKLRVLAQVGEAAAAGCDYYLITVGTPLGQNLEADLDNIVAVVRDLCPHLKKGSTIICRSTIAPGVSDFLCRLIERLTGFKQDEDFHFAFCPERLVEGAAKADLSVLPQIIGAQAENSRQAAVALFQKFGVELLHSDFRAAEMAKLVLNASRYAQFAISNYFSMIAAEHGLDPYEVFSLANHNYPRPVPSRPGFSAGTCLRKDYGLLVEGELFGQFMVGVWQVNEAVPAFLIRRAAELWGALSGYRVGILGLTFKKDSDDLRDSLALKLLRLIERKTPESLCLADPHLSTPPQPQGMAVFSSSYMEVVQSSDVVFVATNHSEFAANSGEIRSTLKANGAKLVDIWDCLGTGRMFSDFAAGTAVAAGER